MHLLSFCRRAAFLPLALAAAGCGAGIGSLGTISTIAELLGRSGPDDEVPHEVQIVAEVQQVDTDRQVIQVATDEGRAGGVLYDLATEIVREHRPYPLASLDRGDVVTLHLQRAGQNGLYASRIEVMRLGRNDDLHSAIAESQLPRRFEGAVTEINRERGSFELETTDHGTVSVTLPYNPPEPLQERFDQLRSGDVVRVEGEPLGAGRIELRRFR